MRDLQDYTREELLALGVGDELDGLVINLLGGGSWVRGEGPSENMEYVGAVLSFIAELSPVFTLSPLSGGFVVKLKKDAGRGALPHACALALVLAAWEKDKREENKE